MQLSMSWRVWKSQESNHNVECILLFCLIYVLTSRSCDNLCGHKLKLSKYRKKNCFLFCARPLTTLTIWRSRWLLAFKIYKCFNNFVLFCIFTHYYRYVRLCLYVMLHEYATMENMGEYVPCNMLHVQLVYSPFVCNICNMIWCTCCILCNISNKNKNACNIDENAYKYIKAVLQNFLGLILYHHRLMFCNLQHP